MMVQIYDGRVRGVDLQRQTQNASSSAKKKKKKSAVSAFTELPKAKGKPSSVSFIHDGNGVSRTVASHGQRLASRNSGHKTWGGGGGERNASANNIVCRIWGELIGQLVFRASCFEHAAGESVSGVRVALGVLAVVP